MLVEEDTTHKTTLAAKQVPYTAQQPAPPTHTRTLPRDTLRHCPDPLALEKYIRYGRRPAHFGPTAKTPWSPSHYLGKLCMGISGAGDNVAEVSPLAVGISEVRQRRGAIERHAATRLLRMAIETESQEAADTLDLLSALPFFIHITASNHTLYKPLPFRAGETLPACQCMFPHHRSTTSTTRRRAHISTKQVRFAGENMLIIFHAGSSGGGVGDPDGDEGYGDGEDVLAEGSL